MSGQSSRRVDLVWLCVLGVASSVWCLTAANRLGATFDEPFYIKAGLTSWQTGSNKLLMRAGTMTLPIDVQTLPLYLWEHHRGQAFDPVADLHTLLPLARAMNLVFWWLLLVYAMRLGKTFGGPWAGRLAVALVVCDPNLLAHASLATTDIAIVACVLMLVYHFWHGLGQGWKRRVLVPGLCYGVAIQSKASGLVFGMEAMVVLGLWHSARTGQLAIPPGVVGLRGKVVSLWQATYPLRRDLTWIALIGLTAVFAYTGCDWQTEPTFIHWAEKLPDGSIKSVMTPISHNLTIFTNAGEGLLNQIKHNIRGHGTYFLGEWYPRATRPYFPVALTMKVPLAAFVFLAAVLMIHPRHLFTPVGAVALLLLLLSPNYRVQIGVRFMFTMVVLGYIAVAVAVARGWATPGSRFVPRWFVAAILTAMAATSVWVWPHGLSYFNQLWGGSTAGQELLHDSNYDWAQGLPDLRAYCEAQGHQRIAVWYCGTDPDIDRPPFVRAYLSHLTHNGDPQLIRKWSGGESLLAVSVGCLRGNADITPQHRFAVDWVRTQTPIARTRYFLIYRLG
jgi:hypothetical protein